MSVSPPSSPLKKPDTASAPSSPSKAEKAEIPLLHRTSSPSGEEMDHSLEEDLGGYVGFSRQQIDDHLKSLDAEAFMQSISELPLFKDVQRTNSNSFKVTKNFLNAPFVNAANINKHLDVILEVKGDREKIKTLLNFNYNNCGDNEEFINDYEEYLDALDGFVGDIKHTDLADVRGEKSKDITKRRNRLLESIERLMDNYADDDQVPMPFFRSLQIIERCGFLQNLEQFILCPDKGRLAETNTDELFRQFKQIDIMCQILLKSTIANSLEFLNNRSETGGSAYQPPTMDTGGVALVTDNCSDFTNKVIDIIFSPERSKALILSEKFLSSEFYNGLEAKFKNAVNTHKDNEKTAQKKEYERLQAKQKAIEAAVQEQKAKIAEQNALRLLEEEEAKAEKPEKGKKGKTRTQNNTDPLPNAQKQAANKSKSKSKSKGKGRGKGKGKKPAAQKISITPPIDMPTEVTQIDASERIENTAQEDNKAPLFTEKGTLIIDKFTQDKDNQVSINGRFKQKPIQLLDGQVLLYPSKDYFNSRRDILSHMKERHQDFHAQIQDMEIKQDVALEEGGFQIVSSKRDDVKKLDHFLRHIFFQGDADTISVKTEQTYTKEGVGKFPVATVQLEKDIMIPPSEKSQRIRIVCAMPNSANIDYNLDNKKPRKMVILSIFPVKKTA